MAPVRAGSREPRHLSPRSAIVLGLAGILVAVAVIGAAHARTETPAARPAVHASVSPSAPPAAA